MGVEDERRLAASTWRQMLDQLCYDPTSPVSIASALGAARESARRARETLSVPMWEAINTTYRAIPSGQFHAQRPPAIFQWVRERAALINGTADATTTRDEGWHFLMLGRCVERADMTSRLVATAALSGGIGAPWTTTLRACGAYEAFLRTYRGLETERGAAEFLLLDRLFPRSVVFALNRAEQCLDNLESGQRAGFQNEAQRLLGRMRAELEYRSLADLMTDLPAQMERLQRDLRPGHRGGHPALLRRLRGAGLAGDPGMSRDEHAAADRAHDRLRVRRQGGRVVQPGPADAGDHARSRSSCTAGSRCPRSRGPTSTATTSAPRSPPSRSSTRTSR